MAMDLVIEVDNRPGALAQSLPRSATPASTSPRRRGVGIGDRAELHISFRRRSRPARLAITHQAVVTANARGSWSRSKTVPGALADLARIGAEAGIDLDLVYVGNEQPRGVRLAGPRRLEAALGKSSDAGQLGWWRSESSRSSAVMPR